MTDTRTPAELQEAMEAARKDFELWRRRHGGTVVNEGPEPLLRDEYPDKYAGLKADAVRRRPVPGSSTGQYYALQSDGHDMLCNADGTRSIFDDVDE